MPPTERLYYAAYGSNLSLSRFRMYLQGGSPAGASHRHTACPYGADPLAVSATRLPGALYFADTSVLWGGGKAFLDAGRHSTDGAYSRLYLLTRAQFEHVVWQENWQTATTAPLPLDVMAAIRGGHAVSGYPSSYDTLRHCGEQDGVPILTFTRALGTDAGDLNAPTEQYLRHIVSGLRESHGLSDPAIHTYLSGAAGGADEAVIRAALTRPARTHPASQRIR